MKTIPLLAALLVTSQAGAWTSALCVSKQGGSIFLRCQFDHGSQDAADYSQLAFYCAVKDVPGSWRDPLKPDPYAMHNDIFVEHGGYPMLKAFHSQIHVWNWDMPVPCAQATHHWGSWTRAEFRLYRGQFTFAQKDVTQLVTTIGANCANAT